MADHQRDYVAKSAFNAGFGHFNAGDSISRAELEHARQDPKKLEDDGLICKASEWDKKEEESETDDLSKDYPPGVPRLNSGQPDQDAFPTPEQAKERNKGVTDKHPPKAERVEREHEERRKAAGISPTRAGAAPRAGGEPQPSQQPTPGATSASAVPPNAAPNAPTGLKRAS